MKNNFCYFFPEDVFLKLKKKIRKLKLKFEFYDLQKNIYKIK